MTWCRNKWLQALAMDGVSVKVDADMKIDQEV